MERFSAGLVLSTGLRMFARVVFRFFPVLLLVHAPIIYLHAEAHLAGPALDQAIAMERATRWNALLIVLEIPIAAIVSYAIVRELRGKGPTFLESIAAGLRRTLPAFGVMLVVYLVVGALTFAITLPAGAAAALDKTGVVSILFLIGTLVMIVAIYTRWFVAIPAVVIERPGVVGAMERSSELTEGRRAGITAIIVASNVLFVGAIILLPIIAGHSYARDGAYWSISGTAPPWVTSLNVALFVLFGVLRAAMSATTYYLIRSETEARSPEELAKVFD